MFPAKYSQRRGNKGMVAKQKWLISLHWTLIDVPAYFISHVREDIYGNFIAENLRFNIVRPFT